MQSESAHLFIVAAPSGGGKTTLCREVRQRFPDMLYSISHTTRKRRDSEQDGVDYYFIEKHDFESGIAAGKWAEWALVHGNYYGTSADFLDTGLTDGRDILLDIDVQGTRQVLDRYPNSVAIFILPPSLEVLQQRLKARATDSAESITVRLKNAAKEIKQKDLFHHVIVNDQLSKAVLELISIIENYRTTDNPRRED
ncbi:MAG: guanylate kinase [Desulfobacterales bacterium]|jgi:guanylate kinase